MKHLLTFILIIAFGFCYSQQPDQVYKSNIHSIKLFKAGDIFSYPVINLNKAEQLDLYFDDLEGGVKSYSYTFQLCNADWSPADLHPLDYIRGFQSNRITTYRNSSIAYTRYTCYYIRFPESSSIPTRSGNYLLKVYLDGDTSKLAFTKPFFVVDTKSAIAMQVRKPFTGTIFNTHQKVQTIVQANPQLNIFGQQDIKVVLLQNYSWSMALYQQRPSIYHDRYFEYTDESTVCFPAGRQWQWADIRSLRLMSDRMERLDKQPTQTIVYIKPDGERRQQNFYTYRDINGRYTLENTDKVNPFWQADYAYVIFRFIPPGNKPFKGRDLFIYGELTQYAFNEKTKMIFNEENGTYEITLFLKQGFYNYTYITIPTDKTLKTGGYDFPEGNYWDTDNAYQALVYYRPFGGRADELIGYVTINTLSVRQ
jgi:hypothetical protein